MFRSERGGKRSISHSHGELGRSFGRGDRLADVMARSGPANQLTRSQPGVLRGNAMSEGASLMRSARSRSGVALPSMGMTTDANGTHSVHWEGHVKKKGDWLPRWESRYLVLDGTVVRYYSKQEDARMGKNLRGKLTITRVSPEYHKKKEHGFVIECVGRKVYHLICETELEKDMWVEMMQAAIQESAPKHARTPRRVDVSSVGESLIMQNIPSSKTSTISRGPSTFTPRENPVDIREFYNALRKLLLSHASSAQFFPKLCRDVSFTSNYGPTVPFWGEYHGLDGVLHFFSILYESVEYVSFFATDIAQATAGNTAVVVGRETMVNKANNRKFTQQWQHTIEFSSDGRVKSLHIIADPIASSAVFGCNAMSSLRLPTAEAHATEMSFPSGLIQIHVIRGEQLGSEEDEALLHMGRRPSNMEQNTSYTMAFSMEKLHTPFPTTAAAATSRTELVQSDTAEPRWNSYVNVPFGGQVAGEMNQPCFVQVEAWKLTHQRILSPLVEDSIQDDINQNQCHEELLGIAKINIAPFITMANSLPNVDTIPQWYTLLSVGGTPFSCGRVQLSIRFELLSRTPKEIPTPSKDLQPRKVKLSKQLSYSDHHRSNTTFQVGNTVFDVPDRYQMIKAVGQGAYGCVIAASDTETGQSLAIKNVPNAFSDLIDAKRILREIRLMRHLQHPKLVNLVDLFRPPSLHDFNDVYIVTELMETDLHRVINSNQNLTDHHIQHFLYQMLIAIKYVHSANVLHRDLKPSNILVNANCDIKLCDFGLARGTPDEFDAALTDYVVTRWYRAPEVLLTSRYGKAMDMWAIGCILAELIGRRPLFPGTDFLHQLKIIMEVVGTPEEDSLDFITHNKAKRFITKQPKRRPIPFSMLYPRASPMALDLLEKMLTFDPRQRITVDEALAHPYLRDIRDPAQEDTCSRGAFDYAFEEMELTKENLQTLMFEDICHFHPEALWVKQTPSKGSRIKKLTPR